MYLENYKRVVAEDKRENEFMPEFDFNADHFLSGVSAGYTTYYDGDAKRAQESNHFSGLSAEGTDEGMEHAPAAGADGGGGEASGEDASA